MTASAVAAAIASGCVAGTFARAGLAKLCDRPSTRSSMIELGLASGLGDSLAVIELFTAFGLIMERRTPWSALVAIVLLVAFTGFVAVTIRRGVRKPCPCFGVGDSPLGLPTIARNLVLIAAALIATGPRGDAWWLAVVVAVAIVVASEFSRGRRGAARHFGRG